MELHAYIRVANLTYQIPSDLNFNFFLKKIYFQVYYNQSFFGELIVKAKIGCGHTDLELACNYFFNLFQLFDTADFKLPGCYVSFPVYFEYPNFKLVRAEY